jgi:hypothetical protein
MDVGSADAAGAHAHDDLVLRKFGIREVDEFEP